MSGPEQTDPPPTARLPQVDRDGAPLVTVAALEEDAGDRTAAMDMPLELLAAIPDPEELPLGPATDAAIPLPPLAEAAPAVLAHSVLGDGGDRTVTMDAIDDAPEPATDAEIPLDRIAPDERPVPIPVPDSDVRPVPIPVPVSAERPVPIPLPVSAERAIPRIISTPSHALPAEPDAGPTEIEPSIYTPEPSAPPVPLPVVHTEAIPLPGGRAPAPAVPVVPRAEIPAPPPPAPPAPALQGPAPQAPAGPIAEFDEGEKTNIFQPEPRGPKLPRGQLTVIEGAVPGKIWYLNRARTQMGRSADNDIVLLDINVSRQHLRIDRHAQGFRVIDLESGNGTQLNDRRVTREELFDGDRIRLGEHLIEFQTLDGRRARVRDARSTDPNVRIAPATAQRRIGGIPKTWIIAWSLATFVAVFGTMYISRTIKASRAEAERLATAEAQIEEARAARADRAWHRAREALLAAQAAQPTLVDFPAELAAVNREIRAEKALRMLELRLEAKELTEARLAFKDVPEASVYYPEARILERRLVQAERDRDVARAKSERDAGRTDVARQMLDRVLAADPHHAEAKAIRATLAAPATVPSAAPATEAAPAPQPEAQPKAPPKKTRPAPRRRAPRKSTPTGISSLLSAGDAAYKAGRLEDARAKFAAAAEKARGKDQTAARRKADAAGMLAVALPAAEKADRSNASSDAVRAFDRAWKADRILGGRNGGRIRKPFARHLCREAMKAYLKRQYDRARSLNGRALKMDPNLSQARRLAERLEKTPR